MANNYKVLGQSSPLASTDTTIYTVPASSSSVISTLSLCNRDNVGNAISVKVAVVPSGQILGPEHYILYDVIVDSRETIFKTIGITLSTGDSLIVNTDIATLSVSVFGNEIS